ncbi:MAG TPA: SGNH/GDSL hydrolase family protein [Candidatus Binatia bacterium]|nr:SGNH/GDSL hydrolase family protein [Candidatus Binatia bacterium]
MSLDIEPELPSPEPGPTHEAAARPPDHPRTPSARRSLARRLARAAAVVAITLVVLELALRAASLVAGDRLERLRDDPALVDGADLAVYGDSTPFGYGATTSFPAEIARATGVRVVNRSRPAINSTQTAAIAEEDLARFTPRAIVVMTGVNDVWNLAGIDPAVLGPLAGWRRWLPEPRLWRLARLWLAAGPGAATYDVAGPPRGDWSRRFETARVLDREDFDGILRASAARIVAAAGAKGVHVLFLGYQAPGWNGSGDAASSVLAREYPDRFVELRGLFSSDPGELLLEDAFHPTDEGHRRIAERVRTELVARGWLRATPP